MQELIKISKIGLNENEIDGVSAKDLYVFLQPQSPFNHWIRRMLEYGFEDGKDFWSFLTESTGGRPTQNFALTIDTAKEISMLQRSDRGKQARQYFIECERKLRNPIEQLSTLDIARMLVESEERKLQLQAENAAKDEQIALMQPKVEFLETILEADERIDIGQAAKILELPFGRNTLFKELRDRGIFFKNRNEPKQEYLGRGYFLLKETWIDRNGHDGFMVTKVLVTQKGLEYLSKIFKELTVSD